MPFEIVRNDITKMEVDAIVCNGNRRLEKSDGVCGAVFKAAGGHLEKECASLPRCDTAAAMVTHGYDLPAKYIIHIVGPHWHGGLYGEEEILRTCYRNVLNAARRYLCRTVAIPMISSGRYGFPKETVMDIAVGETERFLEGHPNMTVYLVVYSAVAAKLGRSFQEDLREYITDEEYRRSADIRGSRSFSRTERAIPHSLNEAVRLTGPGFRDTLLFHAENSGRKWPEIYQRAGVGKTVASKIKNNPDYKPSKQTALAFAVSLELSLYQTEDLLKSFGAAFSPSDVADNIVRFYILNRKFDIDLINESLYDHGQPTFPINF